MRQMSRSYPLRVHPMKNIDALPIFVVLFLIAACGSEAENGPGSAPAAGAGASSRPAEVGGKRDRTTRPQKSLISLTRRLDRSTGAAHAIA